MRCALLALLAMAAMAPSAAGAAPAFSPDTLIIEDVAVRGVRVGRRRAMVRRAGLFPGGPMDEAAVAEARARLMETGLFHRVVPRLERGAHRGRVVVVFECEERPTTSLDAIHLGHARPTDLWGGLELSDIDPLGLGFSVGLAAVTSADQHAGRLALGRPGFFGDGIDLVVEVSGLRGREPFVGPRGQVLAGEPVDAVRAPYLRAGLAGALRFEIEPRLHLTTGLRFDYVDVELPTTALQVEADGSEGPFDFGVEAGAGLLPLVSLALTWDSRDDPAFPARGRRASFALTGGAFDGPFARFLGGVEQYLPLPLGHVVRLDLKAGAIMGTAPFFERFFIGDLHPYIPERALGLNFARRRGPNLIDQGIDEQRYEAFAGRLGVEYRVPVGRGPRMEAYGVELFVGAALLSLGSPQEIASPEGPALPLDAAVDVGLRIESEIGVMGLSVGNLFLLLDP